MFINKFAAGWVTTSIGLLTCTMLASCWHDPVRPDPICEERKMVIATLIDSIQKIDSKPGPLDDNDVSSLLSPLNSKDKYLDDRCSSEVSRIDAEVKKVVRHRVDEIRPGLHRICSASTENISDVSLIAKMENLRTSAVQALGWINEPSGDCYKGRAVY